VAARYHVLVSDELMASAPPWESCGLQPVEQEPTDPECHPGMHWWLFDDDGAPGRLDGCRIDLSFESIGGVPGSTRITERRVVA
jgi:hypothetical protein